MIKLLVKILFYITILNISLLTCHFIFADAANFVEGSMILLFTVPIFWFLTFFMLIYNLIKTKRIKDYYYIIIMMISIPFTILYIPIIIIPSSLFIYIYFNFKSTHDLIDLRKITLVNIFLIINFIVSGIAWDIALKNQSW